MLDWLSSFAVAAGAGLPSTSKPGSVRVLFNNQPGLEAGLKVGAHSGWFRTPELRDTVTHEFGHVLFAFADVEETMPMDIAFRMARDEMGVDRLLPAEVGAYIARQISGYAANGKLKNHELAAEAFADVRRRGPRASALSRAIYDQMVEGYLLRVARERRMGR